MIEYNHFLLLNSGSFNFNLIQAMTEEIRISCLIKFHISHIKHTSHHSSGNHDFTAICEAFPSFAYDPFKTLIKYDPFFVVF